MTEINIPKSS